MNAIGRAIALAALVAVAASPLAGAGQSRSERVRLVDHSPLTLRGVDFLPGEKVKLAVSLGEARVLRTLRAGPAGGFRTTFRVLRYDRCHGPLAVSAVGSKGSRTAWKLVPLECPDSPDE